jgi:AcrR family transcriptional regulator
MASKKQMIRGKILVSAIEQIEEKGIQALTIRAIAAKAGVNSAAINYYFGTKEVLIKEALARTLEEFKKIPDETLQADHVDIQARLKAFFNALFDGLVRWPRIVRAHLQSPLFEADYETRFVDTFNSFLTGLLQRLEEMPFSPRQDNLRVRIIQSISAVLIPGLMPGLFRYFSGLDFADPEARKSYIDDLVSRLFSFDR